MVEWLASPWCLALCGVAGGLCTLGWLALVEGWGVGSPLARRVLARAVKPDRRSDKLVAPRDRP